jgi:hypothetical protein
MAHFAEIDQNNVVLRVIVVSDTLEAQGSEWCHDAFGGIWVQTSYNGRIRKNFAGIGYTYDPARDAFIPPNPGYPSWTLDEATCQWVPPVPMPTDGMYVWDESTLAWSQIGTP